MSGSLASSEASPLDLQVTAFLLSPHMCAYTPGVSLWVQNSSPSKDTSLIGLGPTLIAPF